MRKQDIPNLLSALRILLVGVFAYLSLSGRHIAALCVYAAAFLTDVLDGFLARHFHWITDLGKLLDPFADKLMVVTALICIWLNKERTVFLVLFLLELVKEGLMVAGGLVALRHGAVVHSDFLGKAATGMFAVGIVLAMISLVVPFSFPVDLVLIAGAVALSYAAMVHYFISMFLPVMQGKWKGMQH